MTQQFLFLKRKDVIGHPHRKRKISKSFELFMDLIALIGPVVTIPQLLDIWVNGKSAGVSMTTWTGYLVLSAVWLSYGVSRKEKPIILGNALYFVINIGIVIGLFVFR